MPYGYTILYVISGCPVSNLTVVGGEYEDCDGATTTWGRHTGTYTFEENPC
ncbi:DUF6289 family protein [Nonomuraea sp. H19]|uniref:DUF6289 family protein n=1 Tax=Nonomuraea sp. H19 TaxID=3452206 RepID=UPI003F895781